MHALVACEALARAGQWVAPQRKPDFLFPVHALSKVFRGKFMAALQAAHVQREGALPTQPRVWALQANKRGCGLCRLQSGTACQSLSKDAFLVKFR